MYSCAALAGTVYVSYGSAPASGVFLSGPPIVPNSGRPCRGILTDDGRGMRSFLVRRHSFLALPAFLGDASVPRQECHWPRVLERGEVFCGVGHASGRAVVAAMVLEDPLRPTTA